MIINGNISTVWSECRMLFCDLGICPFKNKQKPRDISTWQMQKHTHTHIPRRGRSLGGGHRPVAPLVVGQCLTPAPKALTWLRERCQINGLYTNWLVELAGLDLRRRFISSFIPAWVFFVRGLSNLQYCSEFHHVVVVSPVANSLIFQISGCISLHRFDKRNNLAGSWC